MNTADLSQIQVTTAHQGEDLAANAKQLILLQAAHLMQALQSARDFPSQ